jgi:hypothetical protein
MSIAQQQTVLDKIRTRGYWRVVIRPTTFEENHIPNDSDLFPIVERNSVRLRGWDYPHIDYQSPPLRGADWVGQEFDREDEIEVWRLSMSGQFVHFFALAGEWRDYSTTWPPEPGWQPGRYLYYIQTIYSIVEIFEFAARMALSPAGATAMRVEIDLDGLQGRQIVETDSRFRFSRTYHTQMPRWKYRWEGSQTELIAGPRELAALATRELFARFGLEASLETLAKLQVEIERRAFGAR